MWYVLIRDSLRPQPQVMGPFRVRKTAKIAAEECLNERDVLHCEIVRAETRVFKRTDVIERAVTAQEG